MNSEKAYAKAAEVLSGGESGEVRALLANTWIRLGDSLATKENSKLS